MPAKVELDLKPSRLLLVFLHFVYFLAIVALCFLPLPWWMFCLVLVVLSGWVYQQWQYFRGRGTEWFSVLRLSESGWQLQSEAGAQEVSLIHATVWSWLLVLKFSLPAKRKSCSLIILPDSCDTEVLRALRVILRNQPVYGSKELDIPN
jgi:hypothetical protein